jgi:S-DNA-T family DNA segregation ATPase FtsK/SpoIIIE
MRAADRSLDIIAFVSEHFRDIIRRRLSELAGLALISLAVLGAIALATWSIQDPSLSHATQKPIHNILGYPGAIFSDLAMQLLGLAAILLLVPEVLLGWRLLSHKPVGEKWRGLLWIVATFLAAAFASTLPPVAAAPDGARRRAGDAVLRPSAWIFGSRSAASRVSSCASSSVWRRRQRWCWPRGPLITTVNRPRVRSTRRRRTAKETKPTVIALRHGSA